jgi:hypothetical protein
MLSVSTAGRKQDPAFLSRVGQNHMFTVYVGIFGGEITKYTIIYGVNIRF